MAVVFSLSHSSRPPLPRLLWFFGDKPLHALEYVPMGYLWARALGHEGKRGLLWGFLAAVGFGATDELHQWLVPRRHPSWLDWAADAAGSAVGVLVWAGVRRFFPLRRAPVRSAVVPAGPGNGEYYQPGADRGAQGSRHGMGPASGRA
ncbi:hypothetical protein JCM30394_34690 [Deferrisoma palaeochoriense]